MKTTRLTIELLGTPDETQISKTALISNVHPDKMWLECKINSNNFDYYSFEGSRWILSFKNEIEKYIFQECWKEDGYCGFRDYTGDESNYEKIDEKTLVLNPHNPSYISILKTIKIIPRHIWYQVTLRADNEYGFIYNTKEKLFIRFKNISDKAQFILQNPK